MQIEGYTSGTKCVRFFLILRDLKVLSEGQAVVVNGKWVSSGH